MSLALVRLVCVQSKKPTALFRGTATGGGVEAETNQRLKAAALSHEWGKEPAKAGLLDAAITGWNKRDKKGAGAMGKGCEGRKGLKAGFGLVWLAAGWLSPRHAHLNKGGSYPASLCYRVIFLQSLVFSLSTPWVRLAP